MKINRFIIVISVSLLSVTCVRLTSRQPQQTLLETKEETCSHESVRFLGLDGGVKISRGESKEIFLDGIQGEVLWYCEGGDQSNLERTSMPAQANRLVVSRSVSDALTMQFYSQTPVPSRDRTLLKTTEEQCSSDVIRFVGSAGNVEIGRDESKEVPVAAATGEAIWYCPATANGAGSSKTDVPEQTNLIVVTRPQGGNSFVVQFFRK